MSFFVNAGVRFVEELCKLRAFAALWDELTRERYGVQDPKQRRFRYGVQVNSLGLTEAQPENNVYRIVLEMLGVTLSRDARARAVQLPAWNEALGLPRSWDQQWSLRAQQVLAYESDLLEYDDLFAGSRVVEAKTAELADAARTELADVLERGVLAAVESGYLKGQLVRSLAERRRRIETGEDVVVGVNAYTDAEPGPLVGAGHVQAVPREVAEAAITSVEKWRADRSELAVGRALDKLRRHAATDTNLMPATLACARAGVTTGEWAGALREVFGEYRAPTGVAAAAAAVAGERLDALRERVRRTSADLAGQGGGHLRILVGKPGLDGHSNGAEQVAVRARDAGFEVVYSGIRLTPEQIVASAVQEDVHVVGLSVLSGSHREVVPAVVDGLREAGSDAPVVVGGIIPDDDAAALRVAGVAHIFTPKDYDLTDAIDQIVTVVRAANSLPT
jgi:(2R)-ethylmalonyl-CoA mutase